ncbi:MAG TPA: hypothetical protein VEP90_03380 [Methylomirabilota bacterium]|nr:hypothetical protein [Candidatus Acidoferrum sp.]HYT41367.1 hypothetical protein [Methylomirabilota bacterium]
MQKILVRAPPDLAHKLEETLRRNYDVRTEISESDSKAICEIEARITRDWITICRFAPDENLKDILTMFKVNLEIKSRR